MVKYWETQRERARKILAYRIAHHEKHGNGDVVTKEKRQLQQFDHKYTNKGKIK